MDNPNLKATNAPPLSTAAISALQEGNKIEAIKIVREERNIGLKEAKDAVDDYVRSEPSLSSAMVTAQAEGKRRILLWLAAFIALAILAYLFLTKQ